MSISDKFKQQRCFISYLEDSGETRSGFFTILDIESSFVTFLTPENIIGLPIHRILKIKVEKPKTI